MTPLLFAAALVSATHVDAAGDDDIGDAASFVDDIISLDGTAVTEVPRARASLYAYVAERERSSEAPNARAAALLKSGEDLLLSFEYARAAATLAECGAVVEAELAPADLEVLTRARLLEAEAWTEAGDKNAARDALQKLLLVRPDAVPDEKLLSPAARAVFDEALAKVRAAKPGEIEVRTDPAGAEVVVDGAVRGTSPITLIGIPPGPHKIRVRVDGYAPSASEILLDAGEHRVFETGFAPTPMHRALDDVTRAAVAGTPGAAALRELAAALAAAHIAGATLRGVRTVDGKPVIVVRTIAALTSSSPPWAPSASATDVSPIFAPSAAVKVAAAPPVGGGVVDEGLPLWAYVAGGVGAAVVVGAGVAAAVALWPKPSPEPVLGVVLEL